MNSPSTPIVVRNAHRDTFSLPATVQMPDGTSLATSAWPATATARSSARGVALIVHGVGEHAQRYGHVAAHLNAHGWHVAGYDHRGHGRSGGRRGVLSHDDAYLQDLALLIDEVRAAAPGLPLVLIGHSMGGAIAGRFVSALAEPEERTMWLRPVDALVLSSPALALHLTPIQKILMGSLGRLFPDIAIGNGLKPEWVCHNPQTVSAYRLDPLVHDRASSRLARFVLRAGHTVRARSSQWRTRTLILWGGDDRCVAPEGSAAFAAQAPSRWVRALCYPQLSHEIFNESEQTQVLGEVSRWLAGVDVAT